MHYQKAYSFVEQKDAVRQAVAAKPTFLFPYFELLTL